MINNLFLDVKMFKCNLCGIKFRRKDNLDRHVRNTHSGYAVQNEKQKAKPPSVQNNKKEITSSPIKTVIETIAAVTSPKSNDEDSEKQNLVEKPNAVKVIKSSVSSLSDNTEKTQTQNAVPVINGPFKLAFKTETFKHNYNIHNRDITPHTKSYDTANIFQKILPPDNDRVEDGNYILSSKSGNVVTIVGKVNEKDSLEICKKILSPIDAPIHYETSFENKKHASIKNIKFKLPSTYTDNALKTAEEGRNSYLDDFQLAYCAKKVTDVDCDVECVGNDYAELKPVATSYTSSSVNEHQSVIVNPVNNSDQIPLADSVPPFNEMHWRKRTSQFSHPKKKCNS